MMRSKLPPILRERGACITPIYRTLQALTQQVGSLHRQRRMTPLWGELMRIQPNEWTATARWPGITISVVLRFF